MLTKEEKAKAVRSNLGEKKGGKASRKTDMKGGK